MKISSRQWLVLSLFNLAVVALIGTLMRYKIGFSFPYLDQKNLQHAHSHFAFTGWVTHTLFVLITQVMQRDLLNLPISKYNRIILLNFICAYGMLFSFAASGYSPVSIGFSTLSIFLGYGFAFNLFRDLKTTQNLPYKNWFKAGLFFNVLSSLGTFALAFMMASHQFNQKFHLASLYYYLHFQYNGFFFFVCMGLFISSISQYTESGVFKNIFWMFFAACIPAYFLSALWMKMPNWVYTIVVLSALVQLVAWLALVRDIRKSWFSLHSAFKAGKFILLIVAIAVTIKFSLQLGSTIPVISKLAFGFRPIIIAYLHLILLAIISVFLVTYLYLSGYLKVNKIMLFALISFVAGVYLNELILGIQGIASFSYTSIPQANLMLFLASVLILLSLVLLILSQRLTTATKKNSEPEGFGII
jgi:hypothetical protein